MSYKKIFNLIILQITQLLNLVDQVRILNFQFGKKNFKILMIFEPLFQITRFRNILFTFKNSFCVVSSS